MPPPNSHRCSGRCRSLREPDAGPLVPRGAVTAGERAALATRAVAIVRPGLARFRLTGGGRVDCLQGLVTCDVAGAADDSQVFGALLTVKGMIVAPLWITRLADALIVEAPATAAAQIAATFQRSLPPRLCRADDVTDADASVGLYGPAADRVLAAVAGPIPAPAAGRCAVVTDGPAPMVVTGVAARGLAGFECAVPAGAARNLAAALVGAGAAPASAALLEERRILAGFPRLGAEIDERTLPQEVGLDELGGVSFTKGCYLGQETVARIHFRGHANRRLAGLTLEREPAVLPLEMRDAGRAAGRLSSACWWDAGATWAGMAVVPRTIENGRSVELADGAAATLRQLPWEGPAPAPAGGGAP